MPRWESYHLRRFYDNAGYGSRVAELVRQVLEGVLQFYLIYVYMKACVGSTLSQTTNE